MTPKIPPNNTSHQWWRWSVIRLTPHINPHNRHIIWTNGTINIERIFGTRFWRYQIIKTASKNPIDECPDGNDFDASRTKKFVSTLFVHWYSVMYWPGVQLKFMSGWHVCKKCGLNSPTNTFSPSIMNNFNTIPTTYSLNHFSVAINDS